MIERKLNRSQIAKCERSDKRGFVYSVKVSERIDVRDVHFYIIEGERKPGERAAQKSAWEAGKAWVGEIGVVEEVKGSYVSRSEK